MVEPDSQPLVIDLGSYMVKTGYSGDDAPMAVYPTVYGFPIHQFMGVGMDAKEHFVGDEAIAKRGILKIRTPVTNDRTPNNFQYIEKILHHNYYNELRTCPEEHSSFFTSFHDMNDHACEEITKLLFESFYVHSFYIMDSTVCSLYATGRTTGLSLECGAGITLAQSIYEGIPIRYSKLVLEDQKFPPGRKRVSGKSYAKEALMRDIKEKHCYVIRDPSNLIKPINQISEHENKDVKITKYELPDGTKIDLGVELFHAPEILFQPSVILSDKEEYKNIPGIHDLVNLSIRKCNPELHEELYSNIIVSGGTTMLDGFRERLEYEMKKLCPKHLVSKTKITSLAERKYLSWIGGKVVSSLSTFVDKCVTKDEYEDLGWSVMKRKCCEMTPINDQTGAFQSALFKDTDYGGRVEFVKTMFCEEKEGKLTSSLFLVVVGEKKLFLGSRYIFL